jgi:4-amino-4-deoxy-L-arabinose transferase-like glycosyltransferase
VESSSDPLAPSVDRPILEPSPPVGRSWRQRADGTRRSVRDRLADPRQVLVLVLVVAFVLRVMWLTVPAGSLIFDETYYVNAARIILGWPATTHYAGSPIGLDPNTEHPPLGKLLMAASMAAFGDNGLGWRFPSVVAGMIALLAIYGIVRATHRSAWLAVLVTALVALDNLTLVHGRIGTLDILVLAPMLVAAWLAIRKRWVLAGVVMAIALLIKVTALFGLAAILLYVLVTEGPGWWQARRIALRQLAGPVLFVVVTVVWAVGGLALLDARYTRFASPIDHISRIVSYGANLKAPVDSGTCQEADSRAWQWLANQCQITYLRVDVTVRSGDHVVSKKPRINFIGAMNPVLVGAIPLAGLFAGWYAWRKRSRLALWALVWAAANYVPYLILAVLSPRIMYIYYALPLVPAVAVMIALLLLRSGIPRAVRWGFLRAYVVGFAAYFPFRQLP